MAPQTPRGAYVPAPLRFAARLGVVALLAAVLHGFDQAHAQPADKVYYYPAATFRIPFNSDDPRIVRVHLFVTEDRGKTYEKVASVAPTEREFRYTSLRDGWYGFTTQTEDREGRLHPQALANTQPSLQMCVDTKKPLVTLTPLQAREGLVGIEWDIRDENLDLLSLRLDYRAVGNAQWLPLAVTRVAGGKHEWNPGPGQFEVRLAVQDLAKNASEQTAIVGGGVKPAPMGVGTTQPAARGNVIWVNKRRFELNFKLEEVGQSGVEKIEIHRCSPTMLDWKLAGTANATPPVLIEGEAEGRYGFTLIPKSGVGLSPLRPERGDAPQVWVEIDETPPTVRIDKVEVGRGSDQGTITIYWTAQDKQQLADSPITISYSDKPDGNWTPIVTQAANKRSHFWDMKDKTVPYQFYIKVEAVDMASNVGRDITVEPVKVDLKIPRAVIIGVTPSTTPNK